MNSPAVEFPARGPAGAIGLGGFSVSGPGVLGFNASALFLWTDTFTTEARDSEYVLTISGLTPGTILGWRSQANWIVDTVPEVGYLSVATIGVTTNLWQIPPGGNPLGTGMTNPRYKPYLPVEVPPSGEVKIIVYAWAHPSFFKAINFPDLSFGEVGVGPRENALICVRHPEGMRTYSEPARRSVVLELPSGIRDAWVPAHQQKWTGEIRGVPWEGFDATANVWYGWEGAGGWRAFLENARVGGQFSFFPDQDDDGTSYDCQLEAPIDITNGGPQPDWTMHRRFPLTFRTVDNTEILGY